MIDLINKRTDGITPDNLKKLSDLIEKYSPVLQTIGNKQHLLHYTYIVHTCVDYLKNKNEINGYWKSLIVLLIKKIFEYSKIKDGDDIIKHIDNFIKFKSKEYEKYVDNTISSSEYDRDYGFIIKYIYSL